MKNIIIILLVFCSADLMAQSKIYDIELQLLDNKSISLAECKGKKILIAVTSPAQLEKYGLQLLDSLQQIFPDVKVLALPASDFGGDRNEEILQSVRSNQSKKTTVAAVSSVTKKARENEQTALMNFLTDVKQNTHFNDDVETDFHLYVVSESGVLYASLSKGVSLKALNSILRQDDVKM